MRGDFTEEIEGCPPGSGVCEGTRHGHSVEPNGRLVVPAAPCDGPAAVGKAVRSLGVP